MVLIASREVYKPGDHIGKYEVESRLSSGGMATLFLAKERARPDNYVAIKVIHPHLSQDWQFVRMFVDEALLTTQIKHPNVVRVDELGEQDESYYLVMEYIHGCSLAELLNALGQGGRRLAPDLAAWIVSEIAGGLHAAHQLRGEDGELLEVIHRDISPQNILLAHTGEVKLIDFGIAKAKGRAERTVGGVIKGKFRYMAPEHANGKTVDHRIDIYALGVVLWEMLCMRRLFDGDNDLMILSQVREPNISSPKRYCPEVGSAIESACMQALSPQLERRTRSAVELRDQLLHGLGSKAVGPADLREVLDAFATKAVVKRERKLPVQLSTQFERSRPTPPIPIDSTELPRPKTMTIQAPEALGQFSDVEDDSDVSQPDVAPPPRVASLAGSRASAPPPRSPSTTRPPGLAPSRRPGTRPPEPRRSPRSTNAPLPSLGASRAGAPSKAPAQRPPGNTARGVGRVGPSLGASQTQRPRPPAPSTSRNHPYSPPAPASRGAYAQPPARPPQSLGSTQSGPHADPFEVATTEEMPAVNQPVHEMLAASNPDYDAMDDAPTVARPASVMMKLDTPQISRGAIDSFAPPPQMSSTPTPQAPQPAQVPQPAPAPRAAPARRPAKKGRTMSWVLVAVIACLASIVAGAAFAVVSAWLAE